MAKPKKRNGYWNGNDSCARVWYTLPYLTKKKIEVTADKLQWSRSALVRTKLEENLDDFLKSFEERAKKLKFPQ